MSEVTQAYCFALDPTPAQAEALRSHCGAARFAFNVMLAAVTANLSHRAAEKSYGLDGDELTPSLSWSAYSLRREWNKVKHEVAPWWAANSKEAYSSGIVNLATALTNWGDSRNGKRAGRPVGFPRFTSKRGRWSYSVTTGAFGLTSKDRRHVQIPRIGVVRTLESTRKLARHVEAGTARITRATVSWRRGRWVVSFTSTVQRIDPSARRPEATVGVDLGVQTLAVISEPIPGVSDEFGLVANPRHLEAAQKKLARLQRRVARQRGPYDAATGKRREPSAGWRDTQAAIAALHTRVANLRKDALHQLTTALAREVGTVAVEDLNVTGMLANRTLARHIAGAAFGEIRRQIGYKTRWRSGRLYVADRWYPSSKTCSRCGVTKAKLPLRVRTFSCHNCGLVLDRDINAARNLAALAQAAGGASSQSCGATVNEPGETQGQDQPCWQRVALREGPSGSTPHRKVSAHWNVLPRFSERLAHNAYTEPLLRQTLKLYG